MALYTINTVGQLEPGISQEWLLTNGTGAFSSSTVVGCNTRRYHGLLCATVLPPVGRVVTLSRISELLQIDGAATVHELAVNQFANNFHPRGERYLRKFEVDSAATWHFEVENARITKSVQLFQGRNVAAIRYRIDPGSHKRIAVKLLPFIALRDFHSLRRGTDPMLRVDSSDRLVSVGENETTVYVRSDAGKFVPAPDWWRGHFYAIEAERGQDCLEDLFTPGRFEFEITAPSTVTIWVSTLPNVESIDWDGELARQPKFAGKSSAVQKLNRAANDFIVARRCPDGTIGSTVIAGYPWFADWGRDTMISLPGLFLTTGRLKEAAKVLSLFAEYVSEGMIPNRFDDYTNEPTFNTVDASLWFIHACFEYVKVSADARTFEEKLLPACRSIVRGYSGGTRYHIRMDPADALIAQGDPTTQLTWMDAKCNNICFTPREGKPVEINALWYNALRLLKEDGLAERVRKSFIEKFWISPFRGLADTIDLSGNRDTKIRPNQIFAASLPFSPLDKDQQAAVVEVVRRELLTPYGLRTLAPGDPQFHSRYTGDQFHRDRAYHNGTIWPWLIGAFLDAYLRVNEQSPSAKAQVGEWLAPLLEAMETQGCIGQLAEIYEAEPPHRPVGCCAQAWSVAEVLRIAAGLSL